MSLVTMVRRIFLQAWKQYGKPIMAVVPPIASWSLPAGFSYNRETDQVMNSAGIALFNWGDYYAAEYLYIVPITASADNAMLAAAGVIPSGTSEVYILPDDAATVRVAHSIEMDGDWYDVQEVGRAPIGGNTSAGAWARVTLKRRS